MTLVFAAGAGRASYAPLDLLLPDQPADVFRRLAGIDAGDDLGAGHAEPGFGLVLTIDRADLSCVLGTDDDGDALGTAELEEGRKLLDRWQLRKLIEEQPYPPLTAFAQGRAADRGGEKAEHAADPDPRQFGISGVMLQDQRTVGVRFVQPGADREAAAERIGPGLREHRDDPHMGLEVCQNAQRRLAVGLGKQPHCIGVVISCISRELIDIGGHDGFEIAPSPSYVPGSPADRRCSRRKFPGPLPTTSDRSSGNEAGGEFAGVLLDTAVRGDVPDQRSPVMGRNEQRFSQCRKAAHHVAFGVEHEHAVLAGDCPAYQDAAWSGSCRHQRCQE